MKETVKTMSRIDRLAPKANFYGFQIQVEVFNSHDDFTNGTRPVLFNNFECYEKLLDMVKAYFYRDHYKVTHMLMTLFMQKASSIVFTDSENHSYRIKLSLFYRYGAKLPVSLEDYQSLILFLTDMGEELTLSKIVTRLGGPLNSFGGN